jgi:hypothetical protein
MNGEVQLIVGSTSNELQQLVATQLIPGNVFANPVPYSVIASPQYITVGSIILLTDTSDPETWTVLATLTITSVDYVAETFDFTTADYIDPDVNYYYTLYTNVTIGSQAYLDLFENESISQNWKFQDLNNFTAQGSFSREFRVPYSENNQQALGALFDVNVTAGAENYFHYKLPAEIRVDTLPIATGYIRVRKVYRQQNRINEVELAFYAETPDLVRVIGEKKLFDIEDLPNLNENVEYNTVTNPQTTRIWTLCDRGQLWNGSNVLNTRPINNPNQPVFAADLTPAVSWWYLFENIVKDAGFELVAGTLQTILSDYWMPWCNSQRLIASDSYNELFFRAYSSAQVGIGNTFTTIPINTELFDNNNDFNTGTYTYTAPGGGWYTFRAILKFTTAFNANPWDVIVSLSVNGSTQFNEMYTGQVNDNSVVDCDLRIALEAGDVVQLKVLQSTLAVNNQLYVAAGDGTFNSTLFEINATELFYGQYIYYNLNAPDMKQIDFVTDVIKMHNCAIVPDRAIPNRIYVVPQNSYLGSGNDVDWTGKLDTSKDMVIYSTVDLQKAKFQFSYTAGEDYISKQFKKLNRTYGDYEAIGYTVNPNTLPSDFALGEQKINLVTQSTPVGQIAGTIFVIPQFLNDSLQFVAPGPRCLYNAGTANITLYDDGGSTAVIEAVPVLNHYSQVFASIDDYDLNWSPETNYPIYASPYNNLFNLYWRTYMNSLYSPDARIMEASFALDLKDILTFQFSDKVWIQDSWWRILEINDYKVGMMESTQVKLIKWLDNSEDCSSTPTSISFDGHVNFENGAGDPVDPTQPCCERYGYNWDEVNAICWAFTPVGPRPSAGINGTITSPANRPTTSALQNRAITNSFINGTDVNIAIGNKDMLGIGTKLELTKDVAGSNLLGKNTSTNLPGIHIGGGWKDGTTVSAEKGWSQHGIVMLHRKESWLTSGTNFAYYIEGVAGEYIELPNDTVWSALLNVTVIDAGNNYYTGQFSLAMQKVGGVAAVSALTAINQINNTAYTFTVGVNVAINTAQHRLYLNVTGGGTFPANLITTASIQYQQSKIS